MIDCFSKTKSRIDDNIFHPQSLKHIYFLMKIVDHFFQQVFIVCQGGHRLWCPLHVHENVGYL